MEKNKNKELEIMIWWRSDIGEMRYQRVTAVARARRILLRHRAAFWSGFRRRASRERLAVFISSLCCPGEPRHVYVSRLHRKRVLEDRVTIISSPMRIITSMETSVDGYTARWIARRLRGEQHKSSNVRIIYANKRRSALMLRELAHTLADAKRRREHTTW